MKADKLLLAQEDAILDLFKKSRRLSVAEVARKSECSEDSAQAAIERLANRGAMLHYRGGVYVLDPAPQAGAVREFEFVSNAKGEYTFGFYSDQHIGSKYARLDVGEDLFDKFAEAGIKNVLNAGNWIDGEARFNKHDLLIHGMDNQCEELARAYPQRKGITTYAVAGDDHEGWYGQSSGVDIGQLAEDVMRRNGRKDWVNLGYMETFITLRHRESGKKCQILVMHPGGGSAYALSYKPQKIVESLSGAEKPAAIFIGHYHKMSYQYTRSVHTIQCGAGQDQTPFMRKKGLDAHVGGGICGFRQDPRTGALIGCKTEFFNYFVRGYYNNRWSHSGNVTQAARM